MTIRESSDSENKNEFNESDTADSLTADTDAKELSLNDVVDRALGINTDSSTEENIAEEAENEDTEVETESDEDDNEDDEAEELEDNSEEESEKESEDDEEDKEVDSRLDKIPGFKKRVGKLKHQRDEARQELNKIKQDVDSFKNKADRYDSIEQLIQSKGLSSEELDVGIEFLSNLKNADSNNAEQALKAILPVVEQLRSRIGDKLDDDLASDVETGYITEERAKEIQKYRASSKNNESLKVQNQKILQQQKVNSFVQAVESEEVKWKADPSYEKKLPVIKAQLQEIISREGMPNTPEEARNIAVRAKQEADNLLGVLVPKKKKPSRTMTSSNKKQTEQSINSIEDAFNVGLNRARRK